MKRHDILSQAFLFEGIEINGKQIYPLSANRRTFLGRICNNVFTGQDSDESEEEGLAQIMYCCTKTPSELGAYFYDVDKFKEESAQFAITLDDGVLEKFMQVLMEEVERIKQGEVESLGKDQA